MTCGRRVFRRIFTLPFLKPVLCGCFVTAEKHPDARETNARAPARLVHGVVPAFDGFHNAGCLVAQEPVLGESRHSCYAVRFTCGRRSERRPSARAGVFAHLFLTLSKATTSSTVSSSSSSSAAPVRRSTVLSARGHRAAPAAPLRAQMPPGLTKKTDRSSSVCLNCCTSFSTYRRHLKPFSTSAEALPCAKWFHFVELVRHVVTQQFCVSLSTNPPRLVACSNRTAGSVADILT